MILAERRGWVGSWVSRGIVRKGWAAHIGGTTRLLGSMPVWSSCVTEAPERESEGFGGESRAAKVAISLDLIAAAT
jgi:hypothetical protein